MITVADCERVQTDWYRTRAAALGGEIWTDGPLTWVDGPDGQNLMFPTAMTAAAVRRGVDRARDRGLGIVGAWLGLAADPAPLAAEGFERGWSPRWMAANLDAVAGPADPRIELQCDTDDYRDEDQDYPDQLVLARHQPPRAWYAAAYAAPARPGGGGKRRFAGRSWSFLADDPGGDASGNRDAAPALAGVFDMAVWPPFRRRGLGTGLLRAVCAAARDAGARHAILNATPEGELLYRTCGFTGIGEGITWWHHLGSNSDG